MSIDINGIAHIQLTVAEAERTLPFWEGLCHFFQMQTLIRNETTLYCIGGRTGVLVRQSRKRLPGERFDQERVGLHHVCFRARSQADVDAVGKYAAEVLGALLVHPPEPGERFAPGYYSVLFEDPEGIRVEVNYVPGRGHLGPGGRLGPGGQGPADEYGEGGLENR